MRAPTPLRFVLSVVVVGGACLPSPSPSPPAPFPELPAGAHVELTDVALAWPLPAGTGADADDGMLGPLLSCDVVAVFEPLTRTDEPADLCSALTATAARLDPCAREGGADAPCVPQLRVVLQPVFDGHARDAGIHGFFVVDEDVIVRAVARLVALRLDDGDDGHHALGVTPLLTTRDGRKAVAAILQDVLDVARLDHTTSIAVHGDNNAWTFEFRQFVDGVPDAGEAREQHVLSQDPAVIDVSVTPESGSPDAFAVLLNDVAADAASVDEQQAAFDRAARVENPGFHDTGTIDCATCHLATPARVKALQRSPLTASPEAFTSSRHDLTPSSVFDDPQFIHAFAWRDTSLAINQRVVNESAVSADLVELRLTEQGHLP